MAKEHEKRRKAEMKRAAAGLPAERKATRILRGNQGLSQRRQADSPAFQRRFATLRLGVVDRLLGNTVLSDLTEEGMREHVRTRQADSASGRTINMELRELPRAIGRTWRELWPRVKKLARTWAARSHSKNKEGF